MEKWRVSNTTPRDWEKWVDKLGRTSEKCCRRQSTGPLVAAAQRSDYAEGHGRFVEDYKNLLKHFEIHGNTQVLPWISKFGRVKG